MAFSDTRLHQIELMLTLDYLLRYSDENHPASRMDICRYATTYGLRFDARRTKDNDVRRQRIADCLRFLGELTNRFPDRVPFVLEKTDGGKYYVCERNYLGDEQVIKILAAVKNDRYTADEDTGYLIDCLLDTLSSSHDRARYIDEAEKLSKNVRKYSPKVNRKIRLVNKAFREGKALKIRREIFDTNAKDVHVYDFWYRVYSVREYRGKPYAVLLPISKVPVSLALGIIFNEIENLDIPSGGDREVLMSDVKRDLDALFAKVRPTDYQKYGSLEAMLKANLALTHGKATEVSFYFKMAFAKFIESTFEDYFGTKLNYVRCKEFDIAEKGTGKAFRKVIVPRPMSSSDKPVYGVAKLTVNRSAFVSWTTVDPHGDGCTSIGNMIEVVWPDSVMSAILRFHFDALLKKKDRLSEQTKNMIIEELSK